MRETVAVIAVHGVGDQQPFETVRKIGDLLQDLDRLRPLEECLKEPAPCGDGSGRAASEEPRYYPFREQALRINVRPVVVGRESDEERLADPPPYIPPRRSTHGPFYERVKNMSTPLPEDEVWWKFTRGQLECYTGDGPENTYETIRLEGTKPGDAGAEDKDVHLYELYWADLSRLRGGFFSIFMELYQLLFHLSSLGVHTVTAASAVNPTAAWGRRLWLQASASFLLTVPILILNLLMLGTAAVGVGLDGASRLSPGAQFAVVAAVFLVGVLVAGGVAVWRKGGITFGRWLFPWLPALAFAAALIPLGFGHLDWLARGPVLIWSWLSPLELLESLIFGALAALLIGLILGAYSRRRPGTLRWYAGIGAFIFVFGLASLFWSGVGSIVAVWARLFEAALLSLGAAWLGFIFLTIGVFFVRSRKLDPAGRSTWSAVLLLSLPAAVFIVVSTVAWAIVGEFLRSFLKDWGYVHLWGGPVHPLPAIIAWFLSRFVFAVFALSIIFAAVAVIPGIWGMAPSVKAEVIPPEPHESVNVKYSQTLGDWLTNTAFGLRLSGVLLWGMVTFGMLGAVALTYFFPHLEGNIIAEGSLGAAAFTALFAARGSLQKMALGFAPVVDILLDIDNWLRELPADTNPKARILGRYVSLLRYVLNWQDRATGSGYDRIVIVAHSQGTVVTADLLRFLHLSAAAAGGWAKYDPQLAGLAKRQIQLFTMGCPLRQMYNLRFPYLYRWAGSPDPAALAGVSNWVNAYRSGDYVGRCLWAAGGCAFVPAVAPSPSEFCIGGGAHTHYWDRTAPAISYQLDSMI